MITPDRKELEAQVAAHPFLIGISAHHIRLLADCAMRSHFRAGEVIFRENEAANRFYLIEYGKVALESSTLGESVQNRRDRRWGFAGLVVAFPALRLAFQRAGIGEHDRNFLLRNGFARALREGPLAWLRVVLTDERSDAAKVAGRAPEITKCSPKPVNYKILSNKSSCASLTPQTYDP